MKPREANEKSLCLVSHWVPVVSDYSLQVVVIMVDKLIRGTIKCYAHMIGHTYRAWKRTVNEKILYVQSLNSFNYAYITKY